MMMLGLKSGPQITAKNWYPGRITVPANLVFRLEIWGSRDNGIPPRSTPVIQVCRHKIRTVIALAQLETVS